MKRRLVLLLVVGALLLTAGGAAAYRWVADPGSPDGPEVSVTISPGASGAEIAERLHRSRVISSTTPFRVYLRLRGVGGGLKAGEYRLREDMGFEEVVDTLLDGPVIEFARLTIPEGLNVQQVADRVEKTTHISAEEFLEAAAQHEVRPRIFPDDLDVSVLVTGPLEGFLYPDTYFVDPKENAADLVRRIIEEFEVRTEEVDWSNPFGLTPYQVLVVASLIEEEAKVDEERPLVSAVIFNRIQQEMRLEIDATVQFAVGKYDGTQLTAADLEVDSPYNTRRRAGLPPGPISSPRLASIEAALDPADSDALFYVLTPDCQTHFFTADYDAFLRAKDRQPTDC
jgi:UPF0755 protein